MVGYTLTLTVAIKQHTYCVLYRTLAIFSPVDNGKGASGSKLKEERRNHIDLDNNVHLSSTNLQPF